MKPAFESVAASANTSFTIRKFEEKSFSAPYHFHPEYELTLILNGRGKRYVGYHIHDYFAGDLVLLGSNVPHCWKTENLQEENAMSAVIHFDRDFMGKDFFDKPEMNLIVQLLHKSNNGLQFNGDNIYVRKQITASLNEKNSFKRLILFLDILHELASSDSYVILDKQSFHSELSPAGKQRINTVIAYIVENFQNTISLKAASSSVNMTRHAFVNILKKLPAKLLWKR